MLNNILGLDLGTNSIGWALISQDFKEKQGEIIGMGSRIIPMTQDKLNDFGKGNSITQTAERTDYRSKRRLRERHLLRRERIHRVLNILGFLPAHYANQIDFIKRLGQFLSGTEPKLAYDNKEFIFQRSFHEMLEDFKKYQPELVSGNKKVPYDWTIYYLRKKALTDKIEKEELAWIILNFNQKRGYNQLRGEEYENNSDKKEFVEILKTIQVEKGDKDIRNESKNWYKVIFENGWEYSATFSSEPNWLNSEREFLVVEEYDEDGNIKIVKDRKKDTKGKEKRYITPLPSFEEIDLLTKKDQDKIYKKIKVKTEITIRKSGKTVGAYIFDTLLKNPNQKIKGKLIRTIERGFYKDELKQILKAQISFHSDLQNTDLYNDCVRELYRHNESQQLTLSEKDFLHLFLEDIIFYQRPLKSKKSSIGDCTLEFRKYRDAEGKEQVRYLKAMPKSHPLYQEFRLWQWMYNLRIFTREPEVNVTADFLQNEENYEQFFEFLNGRKEVKQEAAIKYFLERKGLKGKALTNEVSKYRWNFIDDKEKTYPCNETRALISSRLSKVNDVPEDFLSAEKDFHLWHIIYSVSDKIEYEKALKTFALKYGLDIDSFVESFRRFPPFKSEYGSYSEKAVKKLLPLIRLGKYWNENDIVDHIPKYQENIQLLLGNLKNQEDKITELEKKFKKTINYSFQSKLKEFEDGNLDAYQGLELFLASYLIYGRHSEAANAGRWTRVADLEKYLTQFKQHSLRNPIVEQVITETLRVVKDIWVKYGNGVSNFFDEIHIELGREMKNTASDRKRITEQVSENENTNLRIKALLVELMKDGNIENVRPYSPMQQDILKIYEEGVLNSNIEIPEDIGKISKTAQPSGPDLQRYKLWLEQLYRSPYTGLTIPLSKLFTTDYEIEHIIPQSRYFDDSFSNKVICESAVNKIKDNQLGFEFIKAHHGEMIETGFGKSVKIFEIEDYEHFVKEHYGKNRGKRNKLLLEEIPEKMIERQLNDTRYISKFITSVLSNLVRSETNDEGINSKNIIPATGKITSILKQDWGLNDIWNDLILSRFERMNTITNSTAFTVYNERYQKFLPAIPLELSKGFQKKRIDHRHHALDALIIACATRDHVNLLNNKYAKSKERFDLNRKLRKYEMVAYLDPVTKQRIEREVPKDFLKPWGNFTTDARKCLETIVVSFKQNVRVINKSTNKYESYRNENGRLNKGKDGRPEKTISIQTKGDSWAIRKPMHQETVAGLVKLKKIKRVSLSNAIDEVNDIVDKSLRMEMKVLINKGLDKKKILSHFKEHQNKWEENDISRPDIYYWEVDEKGEGLNAASRVSLDISFNEKKIESITDSGIQKILLNHLNHYKGKSDEKGNEITPELLAFSPEGIEEMNNNMVALNNGKFHQPIFKVRTYETKGNRFNVGQTGNKKDKFVIAAKGTNLFFAVYGDENGKRNYETVPFNEVMEHQKWRATQLKEEQQNIPMIPVKNEKGKFLFSLSPNDLVYIPTKEEGENNAMIDFDKLSGSQFANVYKIVSFTGNRLYGIANNVATSIVDKTEFSLLNKLEFTPEKNSIKEYCIKLKVDRIGGVSKAFSGQKYKINPVKGNVNEPHAFYNHRTINTDTSFEEMESDQLQHALSQTPEERLAEHLRIAGNIFPKDDGNQKDNEKIIKFKE